MIAAALGALVALSALISAWSSGRQPNWLAVDPRQNPAELGCVFAAKNVDVDNLTPTKQFYIIPMKLKIVCVCEEGISINFQTRVRSRSGYRYKYTKRR